MHDHEYLRRREFLGTVGGLSIATLISQGLFAADEHQGDMIYRKLGRPANACPPSDWAATYRHSTGGAGIDPPDPLCHRPRH